jgi:hypothetical protein
MAAPQTINLLEADIQMGQAYSYVVGMQDSYLVGLITPDDWDDPALVTVQVSAEGDNYYDLYDRDGDEFAFNIVPNVMISVDQNEWMMAKYIRLRSGRHDDEVVQSKMRRFFLVTRVTIASTVVADEP